MMLADLGIEDNRWYHDPSIECDNEEIVAIKLIK